MRVVKQRKTKNYEDTCGKEGFVVYIDYRTNTYGIEFSDIKNPVSRYGRYYFAEGELELVDLSIFKEENKEEKKMLTVTITEGTRARKPYEKDKPKTIETISTTVRTECGQATTTCDKSDYYIYTGTLVAAAKITAKQSEEAMLLYKTAIDMWGNEMCFSILKALANRAFVNEKFDWAYKKWRKAVAYEERQKDTKARTCSVCGKVFKTVEEARAHEKWHEDCRTRKIERREAKRRLAEMEREGRISDIMTELLEERKKNDEKKNEE